MKVLVISHMYPSTFNEIGGIFVHEQVKVLVVKGIEIQVVSPVPWTPFPINYLSKKWQKYSKIPKKTVWEGIEVYYPRCINFPKALFFASSGNRMYKGIKKNVVKIYEDFKFDLIHSHVALPDGYAGMMIAKEYKKPLIVTIHGQDYQQTIFENEKCKKNIEKVIYSSKKTIVVSKKLMKIGEKYLQVNNDKIIVVSNGINTNDIHTKTNKNFQEYDGKKVILSVSHLIKTKGIDLNLKAIVKLKKKYSNLIYLIIGQGKERRSLERVVKDLDLLERVKFLGEIPHKEVMNYISICDIFSLPSWNEGFGVVYLEAMAHGKPVIGCKGEGIEDFVEDGKTGVLVKPKDVDSLVKAMDYLLSNPDETRAMGERARKLVLENHAWEKNAEKTIEIYSKALNDVH